MYSIEFEYSTHVGRKVPIIPVGIRGKDKWHELWVFVDTGATYSVFEAKEAERLQVDVYKGKKIMVIVGDGSFIPVYFHKITIKIERGEVEFKTEIGFSERLGVGFNLLGKKGVFEIFKVCSDDRKKIVSFSREE